MLGVEVRARRRARGSDARRTSLASFQSIETTSTASTTRVERLGRQPVRLEQDARPAPAQRARQRRHGLRLEQRLAAGQAHEAVRRELERLAGRDRVGERDRDSASVAELRRSAPRSRCGNAPPRCQVCGESHQRQRRSHSPKRTNRVDCADVRPLALHRGEDLDEIPFAHRVDGRSPVGGVGCGSWLAQFRFLGGTASACGVFELE